MPFTPIQRQKLMDAGYATSTIYAAEKAYDKKVNDGTIAPLPSQSTPAAAPEKPGFIGGVADAFNARTNAAADAQVSDQNLGSKVLQTVGNAAAFVGDVGFEAAKAVTPDVVENAVGDVVSKVAGAQPVQDTLGAYDAWKKLHPEAAGNLESVVNIASLVPGSALAVKGAGLAEKGVVKGVEKQVASSAVKQAVKADEKILGLIMDDTNKRSAISAFKKAGEPGGVISEGKSKKFVIAPDKSDLSRLESVRGIIDPGKDAVVNNQKLNREISRFSEQDIKPFLQANPRAFNVATINSRLKQIEIPDYIKADSTLNKTYQLVRQRMIAAVEKSPKTMDGLWEARKDFDRIVEEQFGDAVFDQTKNTAIKRAVNDMRRTVNDYIGEQIGDDTFKQQMRRASDLYTSRDNIAEKAYKLLNSDKYSRQFRKLSPRKQKLLLWGAGLLGGGAVLSTGANVVNASN